jgi:hypothetical protein
MIVVVIPMPLPTPGYDPNNPPWCGTRPPGPRPPRMQ